MKEIEALKKLKEIYPDEELLIIAKSQFNSQVQSAKQEVLEEAIKEMENVKVVGKEWGINNDGNEDMLILISKKTAIKVLQDLKEETKC